MVEWGSIWEGWGLYKLEIETFETDVFSLMYVSSKTKKKI